MPLYTITPKQVGLKVFQLSTPEDMWEAAKWLSARGYSAQVNFAVDNKAWTLWLSKGSLSATVKMTDGIILENDAVVRSVISEADFPSLYQVVNP